jgi:hypothetical protein
MSYIGKEPQVGGYNMLDSLTASATADYTLQLDGVNFTPESANHLIVSLNGVVQKAGSSFTVSGSTLSFSSALTVSDLIDFVLALGNVLDIGTPSDNTVSLAKLTATGTKNATTFLRGDNTFATAGGDADNYFATSGLSSKDLGVGLHIKVSDTGASVNSGSDVLVIEDNGGDMGMTLLSSTSGEGRISFGDSGGNSQGQISYAHNGDSMRFYTNASERVRIQASGNVSIGNSGDNQKLFVYGSHISENGLVKVQTSNGSGNNDLLIFYDGNGTECGTISLDAGGNSVAYNTSSDYRLKENTENLTDGITRLKQLKPYKFNWKSKPDGNKVDGFYAHEVSSIVPEAILGNKDAVDKEGNIKHQKIDQAKLVPLLTSALQEAITKIETLETENTDIKARLTALENA